MKASIGELTGCQPELSRNFPIKRKGDRTRILTRHAFCEKQFACPVKGYAAFFAIIFGRDGDAAVAKQYNALFRRFDSKLERWRSIAAAQNFLMDLIVQTDLATGREVKTAVRTL